MIGYFPTPYPDELLYSVCARYCDWSPYVSSHSGAGELLPDIHQKLDAEFLGTISDDTYRMMTQNCTPSELIMQHTMFPYRARFLPLQRRKLVLHSAFIRKSDVTRQMVRAKTRYYSFEGDKPLYLRYCPVCAKEDRKSYGEAYLHRSHHLYGVDVCPVHKCYLIDSPARRDSKRNIGFVAAETFIQTEVKAIACRNPIEIAVADYITAVLHEDVDMISDTSAGLYLDSRLRGTKYQKADRGMRRNNVLLLNELCEYYQKLPSFRLRTIKQLQTLFCRSVGLMPFEVCLLGLFLGISPAELCSMKMPEKSYVERFDEEVLSLYRQGMACTQIASKMHVSEKSVRFAVRTSMRRPSLPSDKRKAWNKLDWDLIDKELLPKVNAEIQRILSDKERKPIRVSVHRIETQLNITKGRLVKCHRCLSAIRAATETNEQYISRVLDWAITKISADGGTVNLKSLHLITGMSKEAIADALDAVENQGGGAAANT
ncbi:MAG: TniQ family protein [Clostridia bacterium]|jgi:Response regulator containing a CheY-like receiver domain and an HTH DNA-binding domain|nr:TniQ family protein [Clostridia bacterium]